MRKVMAFFANYKPTMSFDELTGIPTFSGSILICMGVYIPHHLSTALQGRAPCPYATKCVRIDKSGALAILGADGP